jgi:hypothetical protein
MISDIYYDKPWGASSNAPRDIRNESRHGEGESYSGMEIANLMLFVRQALTQKHNEP